MCDRVGAYITFVFVFKFKNFKGSKFFPPIAYPGGRAAVEALILSFIP
jgi:hypothetical protein